MHKSKFDLYRFEAIVSLMTSILMSETNFALIIAMLPLYLLKYVRLFARAIHETS
jgi:hypothetical protein